MRKLAVTVVTLTLAGAAGATTATAAPSQTAVTHRNTAVCAAPAAGLAACNAIRHDTLINGKPAPPSPASTPSGYGPPDLQSAYNLGTAASTNGGRETVAIVDAYDLRSAFDDVSLYRSTYGLPALNNGGPTFRQVGQDGGAVPAANASWGQEIALDIDMVSAICPNCNILLVEANSAYLSDLAAAVAWAKTQPGVVAVSNSYGGSDGPANSSYTPLSNQVITASTGDNGYGVESPASYSDVVAVGGTSLTHKSSGSRPWTETAWSGAGSGCSRYNSQRSWQTAVPTITAVCKNRALADVSAVADPNTGVAVYDSTPYQGMSGWMKFGGTSVSSPIIASVFALAGTGLSPQTPYDHTGSLFDVTSGSNGRCKRTAALCTAGGGWDGPTGLGTPNGVDAF